MKKLMEDLLPLEVIPKEEKLLGKGESDRCDMGLIQERVMNQFCRNERAARTMLADSKLPITFWAEAVNTACYVQNRVLVIKPHNKTPYELFLGKARMKIVPGKDYILLPMWPADPLFSQDSKSSPDARFKLSREEKKKDAEDPGNKDSEVPCIEEPRVYQEKYDNVSSTNNVNTASNTINTVSPTVNAAGIEVNVVDPKSSIELLDDPNMHELEDIVYSDDDEDVGVEADMNNLDAFMFISPIPITRIHKDHPVEQIIGDLHSVPQTRRMTKNLEEHGYTQEEGIDYDEVFAPVARSEEIKLFLVYASFKDFVVYHMDVKSAFLYGKIEKEVYVCQPSRFEDPDFPDRVYKVEKALYGLHQAPKAWYETLSTYLLDSGFQRRKIDKTLFIRRVKSNILLVQVYVDDIIFGSIKKSLCIEFEKMMHKKF
ncbi:putative ribonuclease H-like domain-containing protein [Tanacetum coccineum]